MKNGANYSLVALIRYFLKLGSIGFGGPVALVGYMHRDLVEERKWISEDAYKEGLALSQLAPGPLAAQLCIYIGFVHYRVLGATLVGLAFILPSFILVVLLGIAYTHFGGLPWMQALFYGISAAVIGIISISAYKLTQKSISPFTRKSIQEKWVLWTFFILTATYTFLTEKEEILLFIILGILYLFYQTSWKKNNISIQSLPLLLSAVHVKSTQSELYEKIILFFSKAGAIVFGSGLAIVPFLHGGVVGEHGWLTEQEFLDAVAVAMITPGPVVITVAFIGYLIAGFTGASLAALATFLPCYFFTILPAPYFYKIAKNERIKAFVDGITAAVVGALAGSVLVIAGKSIVDIPTALIALLSATVLIYTKKIQEPQLILLAGIVGFVLKSYFI